MAKITKKINYKQRLDDDSLDLSLSGLEVVPVKEIVITRISNEETNQLFENDRGTVPYVRGKNSGYSRTPISLPPSKYEIKGKNMIIYEYPAIGRTIITIYPIDKLSPFKLYNESILFTLSNGHLSASNEQMLPSPEGFRQSFYQALEISPISMTFPGFPNKSEKSLLNNNSNEALLNISAQRRANLN